MDQQRPDASPGPEEGRPVPARRPSFELVGHPAPPSYPYPARGGEEEGLDWRQLAYQVWKRKWLVLLGTGLGIAAGYFALQRTEPVYETRASVWVEGSGSRREASGPIRAPEVLEGQGWSELMRSYAVLLPVVEREKLFLEVPEQHGDLQGDRWAGFALAERVLRGEYRLEVDSAGSWTLTRQGTGILDRGSVGDSIGRRAGLLWRPDPEALPPGTEVEFEVRTLPEAALGLRNRLTVLFNPQAGNLISTRLEWTDGPQAARIHNAILDTFLDVAFDLKTEKLREVVGILVEQTAIAARRLRRAELALENFRVETITLPTESRAVPIPGGTGGTVGALQARDPVFSAYFERKVEAAEVEGQLQRIERALAAIEAGEPVDIVSLRTVEATAQSPELQNALATLIDLRAERSALLRTYTELHPAVEEVDRKIRGLEGGTIPAALERLAAVLETRIADLESTTEEQARELREIPVRSIEEARLRREVQMAEQLHNNLLVRLKEAELAAATNLPDLQVVDRATIPGRPTTNDGPRFFLMASMAGLGLGVGGALLLGRMDRSIQHPDDVIRELGLPVLGMIPRIGGGGMGADDPSTQGLVEAFRAVRAQLTRCAPPDRSSVVCITSTGPREGKTLVAANLAISYAASGRRTLLLDADARRGNAERLFGLEDRPGLTELLRGEAGLEEVLRATEVAGLFLLPHGTPRGFDPELLEGPAMRAILAEVRRRFGAVVLDVPPLAAGTDALVLGEASDQVLMVLRAETTNAELARARLEGFGTFDLPLVGAVLNDCPESAPYYRYYAYGYYVEGEVVA